MKKEFPQKKHYDRKEKVSNEKLYTANSEYLTNITKYQDNWIIFATVTAVQTYTQTLKSFCLYQGALTS